MLSVGASVSMATLRTALRWRGKDGACACGYLLFMVPRVAFMALWCEAIVRCAKNPKKWFMAVIMTFDRVQLVSRNPTYVDLTCLKIYFIRCRVGCLIGVTMGSFDTLSKN